MKRRMALVLALMMIACTTAAMAGGEVSYARLVQCALNLREAAWGNYMSMKGVPESIQGAARDWTDGYDATPDLVIRLDVYGSAHVQQYSALFRTEHPLVRYEAESTGVGEIINGALTMAAMELPDPQAAYTRMNQVHSALGYDEMRADPDTPAGGQLYLLLYEGAEPLLILTNAENGAVSLTTYIIPSMELAECDSYADVALWFLRWGCPLTGEEVQPE